MVFDLAPLIRVQKHRVDEKQKRLAALFRQQEELIAKKKDIEDKIEKEVALVGENATDINLQKSFIQFRIGAESKINALDQEIEKLETRIDIAREQVREAFAEMKKTEIVADNRKKAEKQAANKKETDALNEIGLTGYIRRRKETSD